MTSSPPSLSILRLDHQDQPDDAERPRSPSGLIDNDGTGHENVNDDHEDGLQSSLILIPPSPGGSDSSLTSDEETFDHLANVPTVVSSADSKSNFKSGPDGGSTKPILGLRDLVKMHQAEKEKKKRTVSPLSSPGIVEIHDELPPSYPGSSISTGSGIQMGIDASAQEVFAKQVVIKGWKVVGGRDWKDLAVARLGAYVVYDITITLRNGGTIEILRRYTDFVNLRNALKAKYPTLKEAIPPLPSKAHFSKFSQEFLEQRQPRLQRFLRAVILHPEMGKGGQASVVGNWITGKEGVR
ncbi:uncharacterized protein I303_103063 [Kwoniella dejecticola CBS 10117]|uniref:Endosomal/vacuolar adapter protein YPT35 n=1 Tax=Kwoniella dejecticola CBS 10117 TaxID=1296121 RepID=A0A1A6AAI6_9TREE|nr:uncharacterized protein I303_03083 [Kwoniella dejecticola CBS 10117]OBR87060.1 hypothetical protein I303_03083 [Kwoniella dejecticola CBS 10117]